MKEKIMNALKTEYAKMGLGDKAFDGVASFLEKTITDEKDIATRVAGDDVAALLKGIQGETDTLRTATTKARKELDEYKQAHPDTAQEQNPPQDDAEKDAKDQLLSQLLEKVAALETRNAEAERKARSEAVISQVREALKADNCTSGPILELVLRSAEASEGDTVESLKDKYKAEYQAQYKKFYGDGAIPPIGGDQQKEPYRKGQFSDVVSRLQERGELPQDSK
jgi:hypothetical protein